ncbi:uncharacterized protein LOC126467492 [Schistocerca serialis cubense]|uniref:uncharacterized protein LOC126467492 n=1 Tax=Schistocerca serialis cubense TaxID=2023355 RepID=UPI00214F3697|nr:uncharacterized protein LOC126467492 [Schistocerca serialis cubense]
MSRYSGDSFRWRRGSGGRNNDAAGHSGHHWPPGGPGNQGYPNHKFSLLPDPYMSFEQQPTWTPNSLMPWLQQESWGWQQVPQATGFVPGGANFSKLPPKTHTEQQKQQQLNRQKQQKQPKSQKHNKQQQNLHHHHNQQQQQQQQQQKQQQQKQQQKKQQQQELQQQQQQQQQQQKQQQQQTKANVEKKAGGNQLQKIESRQKPNPPPGSEEARRKALESTTDKLKRCLSSMGQERTEVLETLLDEAASAAGIAKVVTQEGGHSEGIGPMLPAAPPEPEIRLSPADWRRIALSSQKTPATVEEDDVVFVNAPPPEMVAIEDSSDDESHTGKTVGSSDSKEEKKENVSAICKPEPGIDPTTGEDCESHTNLKDNTSNELQPEDQTNVLNVNVDAVAVDVCQKQANNSVTLDNKVGSKSVDHVEPIKDILHDKEPSGYCETGTDKEMSKNVCEPKKAMSQSVFVNTENSEATDNTITNLEDSAIRKAQNTTPMERTRHSSESCSTMPAHPRTRSASLQSPPPLPTTTEPRVQSDSVDTLKRNVMRKLLSMGAASVRDIVDNPTQSRRVQHALCHLVNEHRTAWTRHMRRLAEARFRRDCSSTVQSMEPTAPPDLEADADAAVDLASLPSELIERLGDLLQLDGLGASTEGMDREISDDGLEELQELQEALCRQANLECVPEKDLSDLLPEMKQETGVVKEELEEEIDRFDASTGLEAMRVTDMTATERNSSDPPVTEFGSLFCDFPDFSSDLDRASNCSLPMPLTDSLTTALQASEHLQETPHTMTRDLMNDAASTVVDSGTDSAVKDSPEDVQMVRIPTNDTSTDEALLTGENLNVTLCDGVTGITEKEPCDAMLSKQIDAPNFVTSVTSDSVVGKDSGDTVSSVENQLSTNNSADRMCRIRTLAARKEYKTNESPVDSGTQTEDSETVEPHTLLQMLQNKFNVPTDVIKTVRTYLTHSSSSDNSSCKPQPKTSDNIHTDSIVDYSSCDLQQSVLRSLTENTAANQNSIDTGLSHLPSEQREQAVLGESRNFGVGSNSHAAVHSDGTNVEPEENTGRQNDQVLPHTSSNVLQSHSKISYPSDKPKPFHKRKIQMRNPSLRNMRDLQFGSKSPATNPKVHCNKSMQPHCSQFHSNIDANGNLDAVPSQSVWEENNSMTQTVVPQTREQVSTLVCVNKITTGLQTNADFPVSMSSHIENPSTSNTAQFNTSVSDNIFQQMFEIDSEVTRLMQRKLELYKLLQGVSVTSRSQLTNNLPATDDNSFLKINGNCGMISKKARKKRQRLMKRYRAHFAANALAARNVISEDNTNPMPVLESAVMDVPNVQDVLGSQTIPVLHREETVIMRTEQNSNESCTEKNYNTVNGVERLEIHLDTPVINKSGDHQLSAVTLSNLQSYEVVASENIIQSKPSVEDEVNSFANHAENNTVQSKEDTLDVSSCTETDIKITGTPNCLDAPNHEASLDVPNNQASLETVCENTVATKEVDNDILCESAVPKRSRTAKSKRQKGHISSQESMDETATGFQNDDKLIGTKEKSLSREPVVKLVDVSEVSMKTRRKSILDNALKQDTAWESVRTAKENKVGGDTQGTLLSENDESVDKTGEVGRSVTPPCVNKRGRTKSVISSKSSNAKKLKTAVKTDADMCVGNKHEAGKGALTDPPNVDSPEQKSYEGQPFKHTDEQESANSNIATTNKRQLAINVPENTFSNYRSTRRKRLISESVSQESSEDSAVANTDDITTLVGSKRRRGRSSTTVPIAVSAKQEESDASESGKTKENRKSKGVHRLSQHCNYDVNAENIENDSGFVSAVAAREVSEGNSIVESEVRDVLQETRRKQPMPKNVSSTKKTETHTKSRARSTDLENKFHKPVAEKKSTLTVAAERSNSVEFGTSSGDNEKCDDNLQEVKRKFSSPKNVSSTKNTEIHLKSTAKSTDSEVMQQKPDTEKSSPLTATAERSNCVDLATSIGDNVKCDVSQESKRKLPSPKNISSAKKAEAHLKSRVRSTESESKQQNPDTDKYSTPTVKTEMSNPVEFRTSSDDNENYDVLPETKRKLPLPKNVSSAKKAEAQLKSRGRSTNSETIQHNSDTEKNLASLKTERESSAELCFETDTVSLPSNSNQIARKRPVTFNRRKGRKKVSFRTAFVPDLVVLISQDDEKVAVQPETSSPHNKGPDQMTAGAVAADVSSVGTVQKEKEEAADMERNQLPINSKSWRMRAVAQIRQCEVRLQRLTEAEVLAATERPKLEVSCNFYGTASDESEVDSEAEVIIYQEASPRSATILSPIVLDEEDGSQSDMSGGGTPAHDADAVNEIRRMHLILVGHSGAILELVTVGRQAVAASEDGFVYCYSLKTGRLKRVVSCGSQPVTCLCVVETEEGQLIFAGSLDGHMRCFTFKSGTHIFEAIDVGAPIQCIDQNWGNVYMGNRDGTIAVFNIETRQLLNPRLSCTDEAILSLKTAKEGPRQVLLVSCRNQPLTIRDAKTGLLMRTVSLNMSGSVYCTLLDSSLIYCGTSNGKICVYEFTSGAEVYRLTAGVGVVVCLRLFRNLLFAGCYDGFIYIYNLQDKALLSRIPGPGRMIFCMEVVKNRVIASSKANNRLEAWSFPPEIRKYMKDIRHR